MNAINKQNLNRSTFMSKLMDVLSVIAAPGCWLQNHPYSKEWDTELNKLMSTHSFVSDDGYTATIGTRQVWVANHPYASFAYTIFGGSVRPKRSTILKAGKKFNADTKARADAFFNFNTK